MGYGESYCCGSVCSDVDEEGNPQICANDVTMVGEDCPLNCFDPQKLCEEANKDECYKIDDILEKNKITDYKCSKDRPGLSFDSCAYVEIVENPCEGNWKRINCSFKGEYSGEVETACWDKDEPRDYCTNDERVGDIDKWCCALFPKENIFCQEEKPYSSMGDVWEEKDIIQIDCDSDILDNGESYNSMSGTYYDNTTENCSSNCWMRTNLLWKN
ncbi:MAG: hypothetical protein U5L76_05705 [Patescibacteria group bacterium]|nr:hypothetical protein [Patescibacteria group bacterium]